MLLLLFLCSHVCCLLLDSVGERVNGLFHGFPLSQVSRADLVETLPHTLAAITYPKGV